MENEKNLRVYMLGGFEMYYEGAPLRLKKKQTAKPVQLLQLLLYHKDAGVPRHAVVEALFGQGAEIDTANSLNTTVSQLRRLLRDTPLPDENYIRTRFDRYFFESSFPTWVDTQEAVDLRQEADLMTGEDRLSVLYQLCELYRGRFLPELDGEEWAEIARADYQRIYRDSLNELCHALEEQSAYSEILRLTGLAAKIFPFDEWQVWQQECLLAQGRIQDARELYRQVEKLYMTELGTPPPERMRSQFRKPEKSAWKRTETAYAVQKWLKESGQDEPYCIPFPSFLDVYNMISRMSGATNTPVCLLLCTLNSADGRFKPSAKEFQEAMERLEQALVKSLRWEDVFTRYSRNQFLVVLIGAQEENSGVISERIGRQFSGLEESGRLRLDCQPLSAEEMTLPEK